MTDTTTFQSGDISGHVRAKRGGDRIRVTAVYLAIPEDIRENESQLVLARFIDCVILTTNIDGVGEWPKPNAAGDELAAAFARWDNLSEGVLVEWLAAIDRISYPISDPALQPDIDPKN